MENKTYKYTPLQRFLLWCSMTDMSTLEGLEKGYEDSRQQQAQTGFFVLLTAIFAFIGGAYAGSMFLASTLATLLVGLIVSALIFSLDRTIVGSSNKKTLFVRIPIALVIAVILTLPIELRLSKEAIRQHINYEIQVENRELESQLREQFNLARIASEIEALGAQRTHQVNVRNFQREIAEAEFVGRSYIHPETGERIYPQAPGEGPQYRAARERERIAQQEIDSIDQRLMEQRASERQALNTIQQAVQENARSTATDLAIQYRTLNELKRTNPFVRNLGFILKILFLLFELAPIINKVLTVTTYSAIREKDASEIKNPTPPPPPTGVEIIKDKLAEELAKAKYEANYAREMSQIQANKVAAEIEAEAKIRHLKALKRRLNKAIDALETINLKGFEAEIDDIMSGRLNLEAKSDEHQSAATRRSTKATPKGQHESQKAEPEVVETVHAASVRKIFPLRIKKSSVVALLIGFMALLGALELFTTFAPVQRSAGNIVAILPERGLSRVVGAEAAANFRAADSIFAALSNRPVISDVNGEVLQSGIMPLPQDFLNMLLQIENHRYLNTFVIDYKRLYRALQTRGGAGGASGLTQQLARGPFFLNDQANTVSRKFKELLLALGLRAQFSPTEIAEFYAYSVFLGGAVKGFHEASHSYFGRPLSELTKAEMAALITLLPAPNLRSSNTQVFQRGYGIVLHSLTRSGLIDENEATQARENITAMRRTHSLDGNGFAELISYVNQSHTGERHVVVSTSEDVQRRIHEVRQNMLHAFPNSDAFILVAHRDKLVGISGRSALGKTSSWVPASSLKPLIYGLYMDATGKNAHHSVPVCEREIIPGWSPRNPMRRGTAPASCTDSIANSLALSDNVPIAEIGVGQHGPEIVNALSTTPLAGYFDTSKPATFLGPNKIAPIELLRLLQVFAPPYGSYPERLEAGGGIPSQIELLSSESAREVVFAMTQSHVHRMGTLSSAPVEWEPEFVAAKTGTASQFRSGTLFVTTPGGLTILVGIAGKDDSFRGVRGSNLAVYADEILNIPGIRHRAGIRPFQDSGRYLVSN